MSKVKSKRTSKKSESLTSDTDELFNRIQVIFKEINIEFGEGVTPGKITAGQKELRTCLSKYPDDPKKAVDWLEKREWDLDERTMRLAMNIAKHRFLEFQIMFELVPASVSFIHDLEKGHK